VSSVPRSVVVIGVGNALRGDDAAGLVVARRLADLDGLTGIEVRSHEGEGTALFGLWDGADAVVVVDTVRSGAAPGTIHRVDASSTPVPVPLRRASSHAVGLADAIELARALGRLPRTVVVCGVEGGSFDTGDGLSDAVARSTERLVDAVHREALALLARLPVDP
jgi:hydrogenase maturation protease